MAKLRVYELARDLNTTNKDLLDKIKELNIDVKSHMSSLEDEDLSRIKTYFLGGSKESGKMEEMRVKPTVIRRRKKIAEPGPDAEKGTHPQIETSESDVPAQETGVEAEKEFVSKEEPEAKDVVEDTEMLKPAITEKIEEPAEPAMEPLKTVKPDAVGMEPAPPEKIEETKVVTQPGPPKFEKKHTGAKIIKLPDKILPPELHQRPPRVEGVGAVPVIPAVPLDEESDSDKKKNRKKKKGLEAKRPDEVEDDRSFFKKKISFKKKSVVEGDALYDDEWVRGKKRKGSKTKAVIGQKTQITTPKAIKRRIKIDETIALSDLAKRMGIKAGEMIQKLMSLGAMATVNQTVDFETAVLVASEFDYELERASFEEDIVLQKEADDPAKMVARPPVVTIMGHVDHGKTSLLDVIRKTHVTDTEAGGITQHIGAYNVKTEKGQIIFLDTPGHEAVTSMRARGAMVTDIVVLVVAADDGVMPQTIEAINHSKAANVPIIVAINKMDKENADPERVKRELADHGIVAEAWGGDAIFVHVSAKKVMGIDELLDMILLQAEVLELKANPDKRAVGNVIESKIDVGRGPVATILIKDGTLRAGDSVVCGIHYGKIRAMLNDTGQPVGNAGPSIPVEVLGLNGVPMAGDEMISVEDEKSAKQVSVHRIQKQRAKELAKTNRLSLEKLFEKMKEGHVKDLNLIIKADVHGSIEALNESLIKISSAEVKVTVIHSATGAISESDVSLAAVSDAIILGLNVRPSAKAHELAVEENVDIRFYDIIYNAIKDIRDAIEGLMSSSFEEKTLGRAEVRETFVIPKKGTIAGCSVTDGKIERGKMARLLRDGVVVYDGKIASLRRFKDDAKEVMAGYECGIGIENFNDIKLGDIIECYYLEEIKPKLQ